MKYIYQAGIIIGVSFVGEVLYTVLPFPVPASVYGMVLMLILLCTKVIKLSQIEETSSYFLAVMPLLFVEPTVKLMTSFDLIQGQILKLGITCILSSFAVLSVTGITAQAVIRKKKKSKKGEKTNE